MSDSCCAHKPEPVNHPPRYRRVLWVALALNLVMFVIEMTTGWRADSAALLGDAIDFLGDAANYGLTLAVLSMGLVWRARSALVKGLSMGLFGCYVIGQAAWNGFTGAMPEPATMGVVGLLALLVNLAVAGMLYAYRNGDANMRSVWLCSRNDAISNIAVMLAAGAVSVTGSGWPDLAVAAGMGLLALNSASSVIRLARAEIAAAPASTHSQ